MSKELDDLEDINEQTKMRQNIHINGRGLKNKGFCTMIGKGTRPFDGLKHMKKKPVTLYTNNKK